MCKVLSVQLDWDKKPPLMHPLARLLLVNRIAHPASHSRKRTPTVQPLRILRDSHAFVTLISCDNPVITLAQGLISLDREKEIPSWQETSCQQPGCAKLVERLYRRSCCRDWFGGCCGVRQCGHCCGRKQGRRAGVYGRAGCKRWRFDCRLRGASSQHGSEQ